MKTVCLFLLIPTLLLATDRPRMLYNSLDPLSVSQHLALYELYPNTPEGQRALSDAWRLLSTQGFYGSLKTDINGIIALVNKQPNQELPKIEEEELAAIEKLAHHFPNRKLKGFQVTNESDVIALPPEEIDLARGLFLSQFDNDLEKVRSYEAMIDLMALQIEARLTPDATPKKKIREMNRFIFEEMGFRFPPHSLFAKDIDDYTFLSSVIDSRRGVCLGVSILYICLAQRLDLPLEMITPPGHIYVRYREGERIINIETTARGIDLDSEVYLGIDTCELQHRNVKEVIGLAYFNQASVFWQDESYEKGLEAYLKAEKYIPNDLLLKELMGYNYLMVGQKEKGLQLLKEIRRHPPRYTISQHTLVEDILNGKVDVEGIKAVFKHVDEKRESILEKKEELEKIVERSPDFRDGRLSLAITWLQLHRAKEALEHLVRYHELHPHDPRAEFYLTILHAERMNYPKAWEHFHQTKDLVEARDHHPKALKNLRKQLTLINPE